MGWQRQRATADASTRASSDSSGGLPRARNYSLRGRSCSRQPAQGGAHYFWGYLDELRVSKGSARWTAPFTPPTVAYGGGGLYFMDTSGAISPLLR
jgi:hypothetical protein